jgi:hypothetical protein
MNRLRFRNSQLLSDEADLSVDVMRFFAIVAICLFALAPVIDGQGQVHVQQGLVHRQPLAIEQGAHMVSPVSNVQSASPQTAAFESENQDGTLGQNPPAPVDDARQNDVPSESKGIRFVSQGAFDSAIGSKSISLWVETNNARFVYDVDMHKFRPGDEFTLLYPIREAEIGEALKRLAPQGPDQTAKRWYITLPFDTVKQASAQLRTADSWILLSAQAGIIPHKESR